MDQFTRGELEVLMAPSGEHCVSLYLPTHRAPVEGRQDLIRFKNMLKEAEERLIRGGLAGAEAREFLTPLQKLQEDLSFWQHRSDGAAVFLSRDIFRHFRLPMRFEEQVTVSPRFHLKPLIPFFTGDSGFFILAVSQKDIRLLQGNRYGAWEVELENIPTSLAEALNYDEPDRQFQFHSKTSVGTGRRYAVFFAHGVGLDDNKDDIHRYLLRVDKGLQEVLKSEQAPLLLAGVDYILSIYREVNSYPHLLEEGILGNPEALRLDELHTRAWKMVQPYYMKAREEAVSLYRQMAGTGRTSKEMEEILPSAAQGRIETLLAARGIQVWGTYATDQGIVRLHGKPTADSEDLLDLAAIQTILNGGMVYIMEPETLPEESPLMAVFRY